MSKPYYQDKWVTIYHGDCREILSQLDVKVDLVLTDPPYGIEYQSSHRQKQFDQLEGDKLYPAEWLSKILDIDATVLYLFCGEQNLDIAKEALIEAKYQFRRLLVWDKGNTTGGDLNNYGNRCEFILYGVRVFKVMKLRGSRDSNVISIPRIPAPPVGRLLHPTQKPDSLLSYLIFKSTDYEQLILDPFLGSGTTCYCAKKLNRYSIGIEIEEKYCEIAARRCSQGVMELI